MGPGQKEVKPQERKDWQEGKGWEQLQWPRQSHLGLSISEANGGSSVSHLDFVQKETPVNVVFPRL